MEIRNISNIAPYQGTGNIEVNTAKEDSSFSSALDEALKNLSLTTEREDKYCSMCGSMIKADGSCPLCIVPLFISGKGRSVQNTSQTNDGHPAITYKPFIFSNGNARNGK